MSREIKRVPLDFNWPIRTVWSGYVMSDNLRPSPCLHCENGYSPTAQRLYDQWYGKAPFRPEDRDSVAWSPTGPEAQAWAKRQCERAPDYYGKGPAAEHREAVRICGLWNRHWSHHLNQADVDVLVEANRLMDLTHDWSRDTGWVPNGHRPTAIEVNRWSLSGFGHDSLNSWIVIKAECKRLGVSEKCAHCNGTHDIFADDDHRKAHDEWERTEPPVGTAWQMWETTSEGSPISPPCETPLQLARWLTRTGASAFGGDTATEQQWLAMINAGHSHASMVISNGVVMSGVAAVSADGTS
jgi:hypothetical protein